MRRLVYFVSIVLVFVVWKFNSAWMPIPKTVRYGMVTGVKPEKLAQYKELHAHPWPKVIEKIKECNIENYSIYLQKIENKYYLFSYFEYTGDDFDADMKKMAADTTTQRWWRETDPCQQPLPEAMANKQIWHRVEEVFHSN
ncbi:L-rhamnose mutarotase [Solitalea lacus]|uniref:L-rhamnose mutarotase n=1 Tax=Solitalea lacus TaxID=2911172 RepID=UPI001EDC652C|nr:L-rhamnose mutarotase [Solitalea lacus]UKJ09316.1 L-rhamnose mutarotase [Solitalea lacus]